MIKWLQLLILWIFFIHCSQFMVLGTDLFEDGEAECRTLRNPGCLSACRLKITIAFQSFRLSLIFLSDYPINKWNCTRTFAHLSVWVYHLYERLSVVTFISCVLHLLSSFVLACLYFCKLHTHTHTTTTTNEKKNLKYKVTKKTYIIVIVEILAITLKACFCISNVWQHA